MKIARHLSIVAFASACESHREAVEVAANALPTPAITASALPPTPKPLPRRALPSFEDAWGERPDDLDAGPGLTLAELASPMQPATFLRGCDVPPTTKITVKVVVHDQMPIGVTVIAVPEDRALRECIDDAVRQLRWPVSQGYDAVTTTY